MVGRSVPPEGTGGSPAVLRVSREFEGGSLKQSKAMHSTAPQRHAMQSKAQQSKTKQNKESKTDRTDKTKKLRQNQKGNIEREARRE